MITRAERRDVLRSTVGGALLIALAVVVVALLLGRGPSYTLHARFANAGQLIEGGQVQVAGRKVGTIADITLSDDGQADVELSIDDDHLTPLRAGTRAAIRAVGQAGVASRFVELTPGPARAPELRDGATLPLTQTSGIVDLDQLLNAFGPSQRRAVAALVDHSAEVFAGSGARYFNAMLRRLSPAVVETQATVRELAYDRRALGDLIRTSADASRALASRPGDLEGAAVNAARTFAAIDRERAALASVLVRAPGVLAHATGTLARTSRTVDAVRPALRAVPAAARPLRGLLAEMTPALSDSAPVVASLDKQLPALRQSLSGLRRLDGPGVAALRSLAPALREMQPMLRGLRYYAPDFLLGVTNGLAGLLASSYNSGGHYARLSFVQFTQNTLSGFPSALLTKFPLVPGLLNLRTRLLAPCPGSAEPPAPDRSNPWVPEKGLCDPGASIPESVNTP
jgi:phospholipid/cholesterol/gamma-HCH transport system substrate-binding protein